MKFIKYITNVIKIYEQLDEKKQITFYSESKNDWPHLEKLLYEILNNSDVYVCYISSDHEDPGLRVTSNKFQSFLIDNGYLRNWLFKNLKTKICFMTLPDLDNFQLKKSKYDVHYVYVHHSLVSMHTVYRKKAFNSYDTIFCPARHHIEEINQITKLYNIKEKQIIKFSYTKIDNLIEKRITQKTNYDVRVLVAPSWGKNCIIENGEAMNIIKKFLKLGFEVVLRPHPQTIKYAKDKLDSIQNNFSEYDKFSINDDLLDETSFYNSDFMISDWSGVAFEYAFGLLKPVIFVGTEMKINNEDYKKTNLPVFEDYMREIVGEIYDENKIYNVNNIKKINEKDVFKYIFSNKSTKGNAINFIEKMINK